MLAACRLGKTIIPAKHVGVPKTRLAGNVTRFVPTEPSRNAFIPNIQIIERTGRPAQTREVANLMVTRQLPVPNKNLTNVISARLSNSDKLEGRRGLGWWPKGRPWPDDLLATAEVANENGALNGHPASTPDAGEVAASPIENREGESLSG